MLEVSGGSVEYFELFAGAWLGHCERGVAVHGMVRVRLKAEEERLW